MLKYPQVTDLRVLWGIMKEFAEMLYQYDRDYVFDSSKFEKAYGFEPTSYKDGIREVIKVG